MIDYDDAKAIDPRDIAMVECPHCEGTGLDPDSDADEQDCPRCEGFCEIPEQDVRDEWEAYAADEAYDAAADGE